ncbi:MAG: polysaccharide biosynthesis/export family protein [Candidatus Omnitrophica bacterium]|nr:polysaccharide biosynthesis/export family protein [Candidatus Omnitrophota bacterium]
MSRLKIIEEIYFKNSLFLAGSLVLGFIFAFFIWTNLCFSQSGVADDSLYLIGKGDTLEISVWGYDELTRTITVRPDGRISFPLIDEDILAEGITPQSLKAKLTELLSIELKNPKVSVIITSFVSKRIWVLGEVSSPGAYPFTGKLSVLEAVVQAGGYKNSACLESAMIIRNFHTDKPEVFRVDLSKVISGEDVQAFELQASDVVYMPRHFIAKLDSFLNFFRRNVGTYPMMY